MNIDKHFIGNYEKKVWDCWTLVQDIFLEEHGVKLPNYPSFTTDDEEFRKEVFANVLLEEQKVPQKGLMAHYINGGVVHAGYVLNEKEYIHRPETGTRVDKLRPIVKMYKVRGVKYE